MQPKQMHQLIENILEPPVLQRNLPHTAWTERGMNWFLGQYMGQARFSDGEKFTKSKQQKRTKEFHDRHRTTPHWQINPSMAEKHTRWVDSFIPEKT